jgi:hypothetical protein
MSKVRVIKNKYLIFYPPKPSLHFCIQGSPPPPPPLQKYRHPYLGVVWRSTWWPYYEALFYRPLSEHVYVSTNEIHWSYLTQSVLGNVLKSNLHCFSIEIDRFCLFCHFFLLRKTSLRQTCCYRCGSGLFPNASTSESLDKF